MLLLLASLLTGCGAGKISLGDADTAAARDGETGAGDTDPAEDTGAGDTDDTDARDTDDTSGGHTDVDTGGDTEDTGGPAPADCAPYGMVADEQITVAYGASVDAYDASRGVWSPANSSADATIAVNEVDACAVSVAGTISGAVWVGPGGDASAVCVDYGGSVTGATGTLASAVTMPTVVLPSGMPASIGDVTKGWAETWALSADTTVDDLTLGYASVVEVTGNVTLVVDGDLALDSATITIASGSTFSLYVTGSVRVGWGAAVNTDGEPARLRLYIEDGEDLTIDYGGAMNAVVEQPGGRFSNGGAFSGTWIGEEWSSAWAATTHVDTSRLCP